MRHTRPGVRLTAYRVNGIVLFGNYQNDAVGDDGHNTIGVLCKKKIQNAKYLKRFNEQANSDLHINRIK